MAQSSACLISIIPNLMGGEGHIIPYHQALGQALEAIGWQHQVWLPPEPSSLNLPAHWQVSLPPFDLEAEGDWVGKISRLPAVWQLGKKLGERLQTWMTQNLAPATPIIFLERFIHLQLLALVIAITQIPRPQRSRLRVWLLYRRDVHQDATRPLYRWLHQCLFHLLGSPNCRFMTDSEPLSQSLAAYFGVPFQVLPIPHTDFPAAPSLRELSTPIYCWWPGSPRAEKGWSTIQALAATPLLAPLNCCLVTAGCAQLSPHPQGVAAIALGDRLSRGEYTHWLLRSQIILLPYDALAYRERTSGIFTEAIIAGRLPLVRAQTWMARELIRYQLETLILDWEEPQRVWEQIRAIVHNPQVATQLAIMQKDYQSFHCLSNFAAIFSGQFL